MTSTDEVADSTPVRLAARIGIGAYGLTHVLIAFLAVQVAFGDSSERTDQSGAFRTLADDPLGVVLLWVLAIGFAAVVLWRTYEALRGFSWETERWRALRRRAQSAGRAVVFAVLCGLAVTTALGGGGGGGGQGATAGVLGLPGGQILVAIVGVGIVVTGGFTVWNGWEKSFRDDMTLPIDPMVRTIVVRSGQIGYIAKGLALLLVGVLVVVAAVRFDPGQASGLDAALKTLVDQPYGPYLLVAMALGLFAYGVFCFFDARYHRIA
jgi:hypothetical protein